MGKGARKHQSKSPENSTVDNSDRLPKLTNSENFIAVLVLLILCSAFYIIPLVVLVLLVVLSRDLKNAYAWTAVAVLTGSAIIPVKNIPSLRKSSIIAILCKYFGFRWIDSAGKGVADLDDPDHTKRFMSLWFPHGIIPLGCFLAARYFDEKLPGYFGRVCVAPALLRAPLLRSLFGSFGATTNDKKTILKSLVTSHIALFPGGIAEIFMSSKSEEKVYLKNRKGFVKLALQTGTHIVPIYVFGHTQMFDQVGEVSIVSKLSRFLRISITAFYGRWFLPLPYRTPVTVVRGSPVMVTQIQTPSQEDVEKLHARVVTAVKELYEKHRAEAGPSYKDKPLQIM